jgi:hypothetical protein
MPRWVLDLCSVLGALAFVALALWVVALWVAS